MSIRACIVLSLCASACAQIADYDEKSKELRSLETARAFIQAGNRQKALDTAVALRDSKYPEIQTGAKELLAEYGGFRALLIEQARAPWIFNTAWIAALLVAGYAALYVLRWLSDSVQMMLWNKGHQMRWTLLPIQDQDSLGAPDIVLDALKRAPGDARRPMWSAVNLLLQPVDPFGAGEPAPSPQTPPSSPVPPSTVWRNFLVRDGKPPDVTFERLPLLDLFEGRAANDKLADAFENVQINVAGVGVNTIARLVNAIAAWWTASSPSFGGAVSQSAGDTPGAQPDITVRLTCTGGPTGHVTVIASSVKDRGLDTVTFTAERAAYKLLYRIAKPGAPIPEIDATAAFRQSVVLFSKVAGPDTDRQARQAALTKAAFGFQFARQNLCSAKYTNLCDLILRYEALTHALLGNFAFSLELYGMLSDVPASLQSEELFNRAVVHLRRAAINPPQRIVDLKMAMRSCFSAMENTNQEKLPDGAAVAAAGVLLSALAGLERPDWSQFDRIETDQWLKQAASCLNQVRWEDKRSWLPSDRGRWEYIDDEARKNLGLARLAHLSTLIHPGRSLFKTQPYDPHSLGEEIGIVADSIKALLAFQRIATGSVATLTALAYGTLLTGDFAAARVFADQAFNLDPTREFACYIAAESYFCEKKIDEARAYLKKYSGTALESAFCELSVELG